MTDFTTLIEQNVQLDFGRFIEVAVKQGEKAVFLRLAGGELYIDKDNSNGKRYNKGWMSIPLKAVSQVAEAMLQVQAEYVGSLSATGEKDEVAEMEEAEATEQARRSKKKHGKG